MFSKNAYICNTVKITDMELNYRITVIFTNKIVRIKFETKEIAKDTIEKLKESFPKEFKSGALEKKRKRWEMIWMLS